ncbi:hypothetical protein LIER_37805 [Lithospermum erythrorhizon]|uniref:Uncharacterized protein n=1 Tax=Lithospermum erythrorhizon TaxID=34254 RepID=A0AAV3PTU9_LITER
MYVEVEDIPEAETTSEAPQTTPEVPQSFTVTFTNENIPEEDGDHNRSLYISGNVIPSTLHQCFKYYKDGAKRTIKADKKPFTIEEAHFSDAKFYQKKKTDGLQPKEESEAPKAAQSSPPNKEEEVIKAIKGLTLPLTQAERVASTTLKGFVTPVHPKAYDLLVKADYDPTKDAPMGKSTPEVKTHGLNETQEKLQHKGYSIKSPTAGLGCTLKPPLRIMIKRLANYHITEANQEPFLNPEETTRIIVFQRLGNSNNHEKEPAEISLPEVGDKYQESNPTHVHLPKTRRNQEQRA